MLKKIVLQDVVGLWLLLTGCLIGGLVLNEMRPAPLPLVYSPPQTRLDHSVEHLNSTENSAVALDGDVAREEMRKLSANRAALILDARPEIFFRLGHIPSALSLPRDDFEKQYQALQAVLQSHRANALVVYCSSPDCHDSQMVADALQKLGYAHVRLFRGGWSDWENANLPEEKE
jgi:rhodanese-related sulfurtransferase